MIRFAFKLVDHGQAFVQDKDKTNEGDGKFDFWIT